MKIITSHPAINVRMSGVRTLIAGCEGKKEVRGMKRIQLSDGMPTTMGRAGLSEATENLLEGILKSCESSDLNYVEANKALHIADEELYRKAISKPFLK